MVRLQADRGCPGEEVVKPSSQAQSSMTGGISEAGMGAGRITDDHNDVGLATTRVDFTVFNNRTGGDEVGETPRCEATDWYKASLSRMPIFCD